MSNNISEPVRRVDAIEKADGRAKYIADINFANLLYGRFVRSTISRGLIKNIEVPMLPENYYFISSKDIPEGGVNKINMIKEDWPVFADKEIRFYGQTIGLVVGPDKEILLNIREKIDIEYIKYEPAFTIEDALSCKGGAIHGKNNLYSNYHLIKGDPDKAFEKTEKIVADEIHTGFQEHVYLETQGMTGLMENGKLTIYASCQCPFYTRKAVAPSVNKNVEEIVIKQVTTGGAFGGKENFPDIIAAPLIVAVNKIKKPIQIIYERDEDISFTSKRHPSITKIKTAIDDENNIIGMDIEMFINGGGYESCSDVVLQRAIASANGVYDIPNVRIRAKAVATNTFPSDAMRGFGTPQATYAIETHMMHIAKEINLEESEIKRKYFIKKRGKTITNGTIHEEVKLEEMWDKISSLSDYNRKNTQYKPGHNKGIGVAFYLHGGGFTGNGEQKIINAHVRVKKHKNEKVELLVSNVEMGQGLKTTFSKIAAHVLNLPIDNIIYKNPSTAKVPNSGPTVASRSIMIVGKLIERACIKLKKEWLIDEEIEIEEVFNQPDEFKWDQEKFQGDAYSAYSWGVCIVEVEVDTYTYEVKTKGIWSIHDIGKEIDRLISEGQVSGGIIQGLGYAYLEKLDLKNGRFYQNTLTDYIIPTSDDFPSMNIYFTENPYKYGPFGAKGVGELPHDGVMAAFSSAVEKAIGKNISKIPVTPEYIMELINDG